MSITSIALAAGFNCVRRVNDFFKQQLGLNLSQLRKLAEPVQGSLTLKLYYSPPYDWGAMNRFLQARTIEGLESVDEESYSRSVELDGVSRKFTVVHAADKCRFIIAKNT